MPDRIGVCACRSRQNRNWVGRRRSFFTIYSVHLHTFLYYSTHQILQIYISLHTNKIPIIQTPVHPTYLHYPYIRTTYTCTTPTNLQNPTHLPNPYIPTLPLQPLHPTLNVCPIPAHLLYEQAVRGGGHGCVLPVMGYYVLRYLLAKY